MDIDEVVKHVENLCALVVACGMVEQDDEQSIWRGPYGLQFGLHGTNDTFWYQIRLVDTRLWRQNDDVILTIEFKQVRGEPGSWYVLQYVDRATDGTDGCPELQSNRGPIEIPESERNIPISPFMVSMIGRIFSWFSHIK